MNSEIISLFNIQASVFKFDDIDLKKLKKEVTNLETRVTQDFTSVQYEDRVLPINSGSESEKLINKIKQIGFNHGLVLQNYHLLIHKHLEQTDLHHHLDGKTIWSWVYYVSVPKDAGVLIFKLDTYDLLPSTVFAPEEGSMLLFPSYLLHKVSKNMSKQKRISIAGDFIPV